MARAAAPPPAASTAPGAAPTERAGARPRRTAARPLVEGLGLAWAPFPLELPPLVLSPTWHVRHDAGPPAADAWLRGCVRTAGRNIAADDDGRE
ncbi:hypothetical protein [Actinomadura sp. WMMB 499]|uniref:hypothetical protein n=1 Tax=Actinomadura sp. WMMB 499 TaxID=1219491 RepID=UPI00124723E5|nr:hypothetical protein [Actinomadura sp. WMMB 499]QFG26345.1 hypothetical protein F7P10_39605 [Actinomadura sp. WMMB 499]